MKGIIKMVAVFAAGLGIGVPIGWFARKKISEVQFVETTEEEQEAAMLANGDGHLIPVDKKAIQRPEDIQKAIDGIFDKPDVPENLGESTKKETENEMHREAGIRQMDTQKEQYWKKWKQDAEEIAEKYDTRSTEMSEDVTELPEETKQFVESLSDEEYDEDEHFGDGRPTIEPASREDWERWESKDDGAYDCVKAYWFDEDDVLSDEDGAELPFSDKFLGFDPKELFNKSEPNSKDDPDVRFVYNHKQKAIFWLIRRHTSFSRKRGMEEFGSDYDGDEDDSEDYLRSKQ